VTLLHQSLTYSPKFYITHPLLHIRCSKMSAKDQFDPLPDMGKDEPHSLGNVMKSFLLYYYYFEMILIYNIENIQGERVFQTLIKLVSKPEGRKYLEYLRDREAYTVNVAASQLGLDVNKLYRFTNKFVNMGVLVKVSKLGAGERGPSTFLYALRDAPQSRIDEAAQLYKDVTSSHVTSMDEYLQDYDYQQIAEEAVKHLNSDGCVGTWTLVNLLAAKKLYGDDPLIAVKRIVNALGYTIMEGA